MSQAPSTLGSMMTSSLSPIAATISVMSSSAQGELSALIRVHRPVAPKSVALRHGDEARARRLLGVGRDRVLEIAEHDVDLPDELRHLGADLLDMRRHEMDHALEPHRQLAQRRRRADRERLIELARKLHAHPSKTLGLPFRGKQAPRQVGAGLRKGCRRAARMLDVLNLALPFFGLIFLGFACGKLSSSIPDHGPGLDGLLHRLSVAAGAVLPHPGARPRSSSSTTSASSWRRRSAPSWCCCCRSASAFAVAPQSRGSRHRGAGRRLRQHRLHGAGPGAGDVGAQAAAPVALIFCFETLLFFSLVPFMMALARPIVPRRRPRRLRGGAQDPAASVRGRDRARRCLGGAAFRAAGRARPAAGVPAERVGAVRAVHARRHGGAAAVRRAMPWEVPFLVLIKLVRASAAGARAADRCSGRSIRDWVNTAVLMAALPPALNVFVLGAAIRCLGRAGVRLGAARHARFGRDADHRDVAGAARRAVADCCSAEGHSMQPLSGHSGPRFHHAAAGAAGDA